MNLKIKKKDSWAMTPTYGTDDSAGADLYAGEDGVVLIAPGETKLISTGISMEIPKGYVGLLVARSSMAVKRDLAPANKVGVIDSDYRGEIKAALEDNLRFGKFNDVEIWEMLDTIFVGNNDGEDRLSEIVRTSIGDVIEEYMSDITVNPRIERLLDHKYSFENVKGSFLAEFMTEYMWSYYGLRDVMAKLYAEQLKIVRSSDAGFCTELWEKIVKTIRKRNVFMFRESIKKANYSLNVRVLTLLAMRVKESIPGLTASDVDILSKLILSDNESGECNELNLF